MNKHKFTNISFCWRKNKIASSYIISGQNLVEVSHVRDLKVVLSDDLSFIEHI